MSRIQPFFSGDFIQSLFQPVPGPPETIQRGVVRDNPFRPMVRRGPSGPLRPGGSVVGSAAPVPAVASSGPSPALLRPEGLQRRSFDAGMPDMSGAMVAPLDETSLTAGRMSLTPGTRGSRGLQGEMARDVMSMAGRVDASKATDILEDKWPDLANRAVPVLAERVAAEKVRRVRSQSGGGGRQAMGAAFPGVQPVVSPLRGLSADGDNWQMIDDMRRTVDRMEAASSRLSTTQGDSPDAAGLNQEAIGRQRGMSQFGYNPFKGLGINGVMRRGVFTPGPGLPEIDGPMELPERRVVQGGVPMSDMNTQERTQRLSAMGRRYGFNPTDPVSEAGINVGAETSRAPLGREASVAARVASGDLTQERADEIAANRRAFLGEESDRRQRVRDRGIARGQLRSGVVLDSQGRLDPTASMMVRGGMLQNPLQAAALGVQREVAAAEGRRQQTMADAQMMRFTPEGLQMPQTPEQQRDQQIALGIELDDLDDSTFTTRVGGMLMDAINMSPEDSLKVLQRNGVRPDHLQRIVGMRDPNIWNLWGLGSAVSDAFTKQSNLDIEQQVRGRAEELLKQMGVTAGTSRRSQTAPVVADPAASPLRPTNPYEMRLDLPY
jgi:hypothetical protein